MSKRVLVIGAARSGLAAVRFLRKRKLEVILTDLKMPLDQTLLAELEALEVDCIWQKQPNVSLLQPDFIVISPGIPLTIEPVKVAKSLGIAVINETELAYHFAQSPFIAVTGTNGKTTTTTLIGELFKNNDYQVVLGGNIGTPLTDIVDQLSTNDLIVAEMSSFQLESIADFRPKVAVMLNLTPDHLDRHHDMVEYLSVKARIFENQNENDFLILNQDEPYFANLAQKALSKVIFFSQQNTLLEGIYLENDQVICAMNGQKTVVIKRDEIAIKGAHNLQNAMAAIAVGIVMGLTTEHIRYVLRNFQGVEHRLEKVRQLNGVTYINDSKGTNPDSTIKALEAYEQPIILLAGGKNKGSDFTQLAHVIKQKAKKVILLGQSKEEIKEALLKIGFTPIEIAATYEEAVLSAQQAAKAGDIVLLSPACASWDMFNSYEERGKLFKKLVNELI